MITDGKFHHRKLIESRVGRENITLHNRFISRAGNGIVDDTADGVINQSQRTSRVRNSGVIEKRNLSITDGSRWARKLPEPLRIIDISVMNRLPTQGLFVNEAKGIKGLVVTVFCIPIGAEVDREELLVLRDVSLRGQVLGRRCRWEG